MTTTTKNMEEISPHFIELQENYYEWLTRLGYATGTIRHHKTSLNQFFKQLHHQGIHKLEDITGQHIVHYQNTLEKTPVSSSNFRAKLGCLRRFDQYLEAYGHPPIITVKLKIIPYEASIRTILNQTEIKALYQATDNSHQGSKDRAILAIYYGCGLRASEGARLQVKDIDFKNHLVQVRKSKTKSPRYVPMSPKVINDLHDYIQGARKEILTTNSQALLVHSRGQHKTTSSIVHRLKVLAHHAGITKQIGLHSLRHSIATHLLENGMQLEQIRQFLGHKSLQTTQLYTHLHYANSCDESE